MQWILCTSNVVLFCPTGAVCLFKLYCLRKSWLISYVCLSITQTGALKTKMLLNKLGIMPGIAPRERYFT